jgi:hypothetical protein
VGADRRPLTFIQVALLVQLKIFQAVGRFLPKKDVPALGIEYVAD